MAASVLTVSQVNFFLRSLLEGDPRLSNILVTGEISNFVRHSPSGHLYFSLKDPRSVLKAVMFAGSAKRLQFSPEDGMKVIVRGRISVYEPRGEYQIYVEDMQPDGIGALSKAYEQLKKRLAEEGLFDADRKRPLPAYPKRIGVITSPTGAAVQDILRNTGRRWPAAEIVFCPVLVQGEGAAPQLTAAVQALNSTKACDVIIIGRGGGSLEDLWAFNDEKLARAVAASKIPVVSAVGHETDFTICDFAADLRAPTPSTAAEFCTPDREEEMARLLAYHTYFHENAQKKIDLLRQNLDMLLEATPLKDPEELLESRRELLKRTEEQMLSAAVAGKEREEKRLALLAGRLDALSPLKVLSRGYSMVYRSSGELVRNAGLLEPGERITLRAAEGTAAAEVIESFPKALKEKRYGKNSEI